MEQQQTVLITGGTSGIGYELARLFAKDHYNLIIVGRYENTLNDTRKSLEDAYGIKVSTIIKDLFEPNAAFEIYDEVKNTGVEIDVLVNDAGQGQYGEFIETDIRRELQIIQLNICSLVVLTKLFVKDMARRGAGKILNLSSVASKSPGPLQSVYHGTKAFVQSFTEAIRDELKDSGVTITALLPGATATAFFLKADMLDAKIVAEEKVGDAEKVAKDGYDALMANKDSVVSGFKNKMQVAMTAITPDDIAAAQVHKQQEPVNKK